MCACNEVDLVPLTCEAHMMPVLKRWFCCIKLSGFYLAQLAISAPNKVTPIFAFFSRDLSKVSALKNNFDLDYCIGLTLGVLIIFVF